MVEDFLDELSRYGNNIVQLHYIMRILLVPKIALCEDPVYRNTKTIKIVSW